MPMLRAIRRRKSREAKPLALMVRNYVQWTVRRGLAARQTTLPYYDRKRDTGSPTAEVVWDLFGDLKLVTISVDDVLQRAELRGIDEPQRLILELLELTETSLLPGLSKSKKPPD